MTFLQQPGRPVDAALVGQLARGGVAEHRRGQLEPEQRPRARSSGSAACSSRTGVAANADAVSCEATA